MTKTIPLTKGQTAIVDDSDYEHLSQFKWNAVKGYNTYYATRCLPLGDKKYTRRYMHHEIMGLPDKDYIDHKDGNGLNCTRDNMRKATPTQNRYNQGMSKGTASGYKGVRKHVTANKVSWSACITVSGKVIYLGRFATAIDAALARDEAARKYHGEFAWTNF